MSSAHRLFAVLIVFILLFFGSYLFYGVLAAEFFETQVGSATGVQKTDVNMAFIALGDLIQAWVFVKLYSGYAKAYHHPFIGWQYGGLIGLLMGFGAGLIMYGTTHIFALNAYLVDGIWQIFLYGLAGFSVASFLKKMKDDSSKIAENEG